MNVRKDQDIPFCQNNDIKKNFKQLYTKNRPNFSGSRYTKKNRKKNYAQSIGLTFVVLAIPRKIKKKFKKEERKEANKKKSSLIKKMKLGKLNS